jgi:hypothetical protein
VNADELARILAENVSNIGPDTWRVPNGRGGQPWLIRAAGPEAECVPENDPTADGYRGDGRDVIWYALGWTPGEDPPEGSR